MNKMYADTLSDLIEIFLRRAQNYIENDEWEKVFDLWHKFYSGMYPIKITDSYGKEYEIQCDETVVNDHLYGFSLTDWLSEEGTLDLILRTFTELPSGIFNNWQSEKVIKNLTIPKNIKVIKSNALNGTAPGATINVPKTVEKVEKNSFGTTRQFETYVSGYKSTVNYEGTEEEWNAIAEPGWDGETKNRVTINFLGK